MVGGGGDGEERRLWLGAEQLFAEVLVSGFTGQGRKTFEHLTELFFMLFPCYLFLILTKDGVSDMRAVHRGLWIWTSYM